MSLDVRRQRERLASHSKPPALGCRIARCEVRGSLGTNVLGERTSEILSVFVHSMNTKTPKTWRVLM